jgi:hypothetical protein
LWVDGLLSVLHPGRGVLGRGRIELTFDAEIAEAVRARPGLTPADFISARLQEALELGVVLQSRLATDRELTAPPRAVTEIL